MKKTFAILAVIAITGTALPAAAFHCPADMKRIDAALAATSNLTSDQVAQIKSLREKGEKEHQSGKHQDSVDTLAEALKLLGVE